MQELTQAVIWGERPERTERAKEQSWHPHRPQAWPRIPQAANHAGDHLFLLGYHLSCFPHPTLLLSTDHIPQPCTRDRQGPPAAFGKEKGNTKPVRMPGWVWRIWVNGTEARGRGSEEALQEGHWGAKNHFGGPWDDVKGGRSQRKRQPQQGL